MERFVTVKFNNLVNGQDDPCAWCGARTNPHGLDFFAGDSSVLICDNCARTVSPDLYRFSRSEDFRLAEVFFNLNDRSSPHDHLGHVEQSIEVAGRAIARAAAFARELRKILKGDLDEGEPSAAPAAASQAQSAGNLPF